MQSAITSTPRSRVETEVRRTGALLARGEFLQAYEAACALEQEVPENRDVLYLAAVSLRQLRRYSDALAALRRLERHHPGYARLFEERGHCHAALQAVTPALEAYVRAVALNACLPDSWKALQRLYRLLGRTADAQQAGLQAARLAGLPPDIRMAYELQGDGAWAQAEELLRSYLATHGEHVEALRLLAQIAVHFRVERDAEMLLRRALDLEPALPVVRYEYAVVLLNRQRYRKARLESEQLLTSDPSNRPYRALHAAVLAGLGEFEAALPLYRELASESPEDAQLQLALGNALKTAGRTGEAIESYRRAASRRAGFGDACWSLANLKTYRFSDEELARMRAEEAHAALPAIDRYPLCFALGKALEDRGAYGESFAFYERGNALKRAEVSYRPEPLERAARLQESLYGTEFFAARAGFGCPGDAPIFIVGLPRSGSTLLEQILGAHSMVEGTMELADIPRYIEELQASEYAGPGYPRLENLKAQMFLGLGEQYLLETSAYRRGKPKFIDKMPNNFRHLGLIQLLLPNAKIIDVRREPMACGFAIYKQLFAYGQHFAYSVEDIARYYRMYERLMAHWQSALPGKILKVQYETLVADLEGSVRRILEFCGLPFEPACLEFHTSPRPVYSASAAQVREPLFSEAIDHWRHFAPWLAPLQRALEGTP